MILFDMIGGMDDDLVITKSDYKLFLEAPLHLWVHKHEGITGQPSAFDRHVMEQGYAVERYAEEYLEKFVVYAGAGERVQFQAAFADGEFLARTDALVYKPAVGAYDLYEIKSSSGFKPEFVIDAAFQRLILDRQIKLDRVFVLYLNKTYVRRTDLDLRDLFVAVDITEDVQGQLDEVARRRGEALAAATADHPQDLQRCLKPKDCPCPDLCYPGLPENSIFNIPRLSKKKKEQLLKQGIVDIKDVPAAFPLNEKQQKIVRAAQADQTLVDHDAIRQAFDVFRWPLYFLDYETFLSAVPLFDGYHPQQQMVFQYSLHRMDTVEGDLAHAEHLSLAAGDPSLPLVKQLCEDIGDTGTVFVWNKAFEGTRNREMADIHPEYADAIANLNARIYDLADFVKHGLYVHPAFLGSWSIKNVLPVMVPALSYEDMEIGKGDQAMVTWGKLINGELDGPDNEKIVHALLAYCKMDTYAMVAIFKVLQGLLG